MRQDLGQAWVQTLGASIDHIAIGEEMRSRRWCRKGAAVISRLLVCTMLVVLPYAPYQAHACTDGETRACSLGAGVCVGTDQTCIGGE